MSGVPYITARMAHITLFFSIIFLLGIADAYATRVKDIAEIEGVRQNQLVGYGLIVGLNGTGDDKKSDLTLQSMVNMLERMGITVDPRNLKIENVAAVMVTADLPPFAKAGGRIDAIVSSIGDAESLQGGTLLLTPLKAGDGEVYAVAQGPISTGGFSSTGGAATVQKNFPTVGRLPGGALIEKEIPNSFCAKDTLSLLLRNPDFTTAYRVAEVINGTFDSPLAKTLDAGTITLTIPQNYSGNIVELITRIEALSVNPDAISKVVLNERTGTVVVGDNVRISTVAIAHGNLSIEIKETPNVSQPLPFSMGETVVVPETQIAMKEEISPLFLVESGVSIGEVVRGLNAIGVSPRDLISIFQALKSAGALQAELEIM